MTLIPFLLVILLITSCESSNGDKQRPDYKNVNMDSTVYEKKDSSGRLAEKWGNYHKVDDDINFRFFFHYDQNNLVDSEKRYFFDEDNVDCIIKDIAEFDEIIYHYKLQDGKYILEKEEGHSPEYDDSGKLIGRRLSYIKNVITGKFLYPEIKENN
jgi:hypothetical protein